MTDNLSEGEFELLMPFVLCKSNGGPYDDSAFVAGWRLGALESKMEAARAFGLDVPPQPLYPSDRPQVELLAMKYELEVHVQEHDEHWSIYRFLPATSVEDGLAGEAL